MKNLKTLLASFMTLAVLRTDILKNLHCKQGVRKADTHISSIPLVCLFLMAMGRKELEMYLWPLMKIEGVGLKTHTLVLQSPG